MWLEIIILGNEVPGWVCSRNCQWKMCVSIRNKNHATLSAVLSVCVQNLWRSDRHLLGIQKHMFSYTLSIPKKKNPWWNNSLAHFIVWMNIFIKVKIIRKITENVVVLKLICTMVEFPPITQQTHSYKNQNAIIISQPYFDVNDTLLLCNMLAGKCDLEYSKIRKGILSIASFCHYLGYD